MLKGESCGGIQLIPLMPILFDYYISTYYNETLRKIPIERAADQKQAPVLSTVRCLYAL